MDIPVPLDTLFWLAVGVLAARVVYDLAWAVRGVRRLLDALTQSIRARIVPEARGGGWITERLRDVRARTVAAIPARRRPEDHSAADSRASLARATSPPPVPVKSRPKLIDTLSAAEIDRILGPPARR